MFGVHMETFANVAGLMAWLCRVLFLLHKNIKNTLPRCQAISGLIINSQVNI